MDAARESCNSNNLMVCEFFKYTSLQGNSFKWEREFIKLPCKHLLIYISLLLFKKVKAWPLKH